MILERDGVFFLGNEQFSYLMRVNDYRQVELLHFGLPVQPADWEAFVCRPGLGWGESVLLQAGDTASCADDKPLEWSGSGRGDYRESPLELGVSTDFRYTGWRIVDGCVAMEGGLPQAHGAEGTLELTLEQPGARLRLYYTLFPTALTRRAVLENTGETPISIQKFMSLCLDLPGKYNMRSFHGGWIAEMRPWDAPVAGKVVNESLTGSSSHRCNPGFLLYEDGATEEAGRVFGFNLLYSGNHYSAAERSLQGLNRVVMGINPSNFCWELAPGEGFETPEAVLCCAQRGFGELSQRMHRFVLDNVIPEYWNGRLRPVLYNSWEGCLFDFDQRRLLDLADRARELGCELFVLDDGWFGQRNHDKAGLGDYTVNRKKLPEGLAGLSRRLGEKGLEFGLWFEPEAVNPDSDLYRAHPDWALTDGFYDIYGRNQLLLDLTKPEVRDYIVENVSRTIDEAGVRYVKWDMNRHSIALGAQAHRFVLGLYDVLRRIFGPRPQVLLESCSSGGNRFDLGMLCWSPQIWCSDNTDPIERLGIQGNLSYLYPQSTFGAHVSAAPHGQTLRNTPLATRGNVSFFGCLGYELDLKHLLPVEKKEVCEQIAFYKKHRRAFQYGVFRRVDGGWQVTLDGTTLCGLFHGLQPAAPGYEWLRVRGLERGKRYRFASREQALRIGQFGSLVKHVSPVSLDPNGPALRLADRRFTMPSGTESGAASGAALESGVALHPRFRGTGYDAAQRTTADFGSELIVVEEES